MWNNFTAEISMTTPDQVREALAWLANSLEWYERGHSDVLAEHCRTLKSMLAQPRLPEVSDDLAYRIGAELDEEARRNPNKLASPISLATIRVILDALYAHLTRKPTKKVWDVTYEGEPCAGRHYEAAAALFAAEGLIKRGKVVTITPREVEVPA